MLPRTIHHPLVGDVVTFVQNAEDTNGEYVLVLVTLKPGGGTGLHYHLDFVEEFTAVHGVVAIQLGRKIISLYPGKSVVASLKSRHRFFNPGSKPVTFQVKITPARHFERLLRIAYGLASDGKTNKKGIPKSIWHLAYMFQIGETYIPGMPVFLQRGLFGLLAAIGRQKGKDRELEKYWKEKAAAPHLNSFSPGWLVTAMSLVLLLASYPAIANRITRLETALHAEKAWNQFTAQRFTMQLFQAIR